MHKIHLLFLALLSTTTLTTIAQHESTQELFVSSSKILKTITRIDQERKLQLKLCDPYLLSIYIAPATSSTYQPFPAEQVEVQKYCPSLQRSCCNKSQIEYQVTYFKEAVDKLNRYEKFLDRMHKAIAKKNKNNRIVTIINTFNIPKNRMCIGSRRAESINADLKEYLEGLPTATESFREIKNANIKYYSGFICTFCNGDTSSQITNLDNHKTSKFVIKYKFSNVKPVLAIYLRFLDFMLYVIKLRNIIDVIDCGKKEAFTYVRVRSVGEYEAMQRQVNICLSLADNMNEFMMNSQCKEYFSHANVFDYSDDFQSIVEVYIRAFSTLSEFFSMRSEIIADILSSDVENSVEYFQRRVRSNSSWERKIGIDLDEKFGVDMFASQFDERVYSSAGLAKAVAVLIMLLGVIMN